MLINKISDCCQSIDLTKDIKVAVAVSGGSDSLALALALKDYGQNIICFIVDHKLREISGEHALQTKNILQILMQNFHPLIHQSHQFQNIMKLNLQLLPIPN